MSVITPKKKFLTGSRENKCQTSQNDILQIKFSELYLFFHNSCEIWHLFSRATMRNFSLLLLHITNYIYSTWKMQKRMQYGLNYSGYRYRVFVPWILKLLNFLMESILIHTNAKQTGSFHILIHSSDLIDQHDHVTFSV